MYSSQDSEDAQYRERPPGPLVPDVGLSAPQATGVVSASSPQVVDDRFERGVVGQPALPAGPVPDRRPGEPAGILPLWPSRAPAERHGRVKVAEARGPAVLDAAGRYDQPHVPRIADLIPVHQASSAPSAAAPRRTSPNFFSRACLRSSAPARYSRGWWLVCSLLLLLNHFDEARLKPSPIETSALYMSLRRRCITLSPDKQHRPNRGHTPRSARSLDRRCLGRPSHSGRGYPPGHPGGGILVARPAARSADGRDR